MSHLRDIYLNDISNDYAVVFNKKRLRLIPRMHRMRKKFNRLLKSCLNHSTTCIIFSSSFILFFLVLFEINNTYNSTVEDKILEKIAFNSSFTREYNSNTTKVGAPIWAQKESIKAILLSAKDLDIAHKSALLATAEVESGFNPLAKSNLSSACGLFQFIKSTGKAYGLNQTNCIEPWSNSKAGVNHYLDLYESKIKHRVSHLEGIERAFRIFELTYYLHHDGINSVQPNSDVKAVVLKGTHFLIKSYMILKQEKNETLLNKTLNNFKKKTILAYQRLKIVHS